MTATTAKARRMYKKPPVAQAVCEFKFLSDNPWDWTIPGLIYQNIQNRFPGKQQEKGFEIQITAQPQKVERTTVPSTLTKMQFLNESKSEMVQVGPDLLAVNILSNYPGWDSFRGLIQEQLKIYREVARPVSFQRIGLRYMNHIQFPVPNIETTDYFNYYPKLPDSIAQTHGPFTMQVLHAYNDDRDALALRMAINVPLAPRLVIILDLDYHLITPKGVKLDEAEAWIDQAHDKVETMFEACITDKARELFEVTK
jgi:uncharacterized protein (TIGR04255 family)